MCLTWQSYYMNLEIHQIMNLKLEFAIIYMVIIVLR
jgi:hypothetical protein